MEITLRTNEAIDFFTSLSVLAMISFLLWLSSREISKPLLQTLKYQASLRCKKDCKSDVHAREAFGEDAADQRASLKRTFVDQHGRRRKVDVRVWSAMHRAC